MPVPVSQAELPNPDIYLNRLLPVDARDFEISRNVAIIVLGVSLLLNHVQDYLDFLA